MREIHKSDLIIRKCIKFPKCGKTDASKGEILMIDRFVRCGLNNCKQENRSERKETKEANGISEK